MNYTSYPFPQPKSQLTSYSSDQTMPYTNECNYQFQEHPGHIIQSKRVKSASPNNLHHYSRPNLTQTKVNIMNMLQKSVPSYSNTPNNNVVISTEKKTDSETFEAALTLLKAKHGGSNIVSPYQSAENDLLQQESIQYLQHPTHPKRCNAASVLVKPSSLTFKQNRVEVSMNHYLNEISPIQSNSVPSVTPQESFENDSSILSNSSPAASTSSSSPIPSLYLKLPNKSCRRINDDVHSSNSSYSSSISSVTDNRDNDALISLHSSSFSPLPSPSPSSFTRSISLSLPEDGDMLSPLHCFMRKFCIEAFIIDSRSKDQTNNKKQDFYQIKSNCKTREKFEPQKKKIKYDVVGIRCKFCKNEPFHKRAERSITHPSSMNNIYYSMETWQRRHASICKSIPQWAKQEMMKLANSSRGIGGGRRRYWAESAMMLGMVDTPQGIKIKEKVGPSLDHKDVKISDNASIVSCTKTIEENSSVTSEMTVSTIDAKADLESRLLGSITTEEEKINQNMSRSTVLTPLVTEKDKSIISNYLFLLVSQMEKCAFTEADRTGGRSKIKTNKNGFPGMQCKHCCGKAGYGRYFPASVASLNLANSDRNMFNHLMKCRRCPLDVKDELQRLKNQKRNGGQKIERGGRKIFFQRIWERLHNGTSLSSTQPTSTRNTEKESSTMSFVIPDSQLSHASWKNLNPSAKRSEEERGSTFYVAL